MTTSDDRYQDVISKENFSWFQEAVSSRVTGGDIGGLVQQIGILERDNEELRQELDSIKYRLRALEALQESILASSYVPSNGPAGVSQPRSVFGASSIGLNQSNLLPEGYIPLETFCAQYHIPDGTVRDAISRGELTCCDGMWVVDDLTVKHALSPEQQISVLERYRR